MYLKQVRHIRFLSNQEITKIGSQNKIPNSRVIRKFDRGSDEMQGKRITHSKLQRYKFLEH